jgi:hypothetical protein
VKLPFSIMFFVMITASTAIARDVVAVNATVENPSNSACTIGGWSTDVDPNGLIVRRRPSKSARVLGRLPKFYEDKATGERYRADFQILASKNGWFKIANARDYPNSKPARPTYSKIGWISGEYVGFTVQSHSGKESPHETSRAIIDFGSDAAFYESAKMLRAIECQRDWVLIEFIQTAERLPTGILRNLSAADPRRKVLKRAWFNKICPIIETTCDM